MTVALVYAASPLNGTRVHTQSQVPASPVYVFDAYNQIVGLLGPESNTALMQVGNHVVAITVRADEIPRDFLTFYYETPDCSGTRYMAASSLPRRGTRFSNSVYDPAGELRVFRPIRFRQSPYSICDRSSSGLREIPYAEVSSFAISHFAPPFRVGQ